LGFSVYLIMKEIESIVSGRVFKVDMEAEPLLIPLLCARVAAGFPSPADDYIETTLDLNKDLIRHPETTYFLRASGDSMIGEGIKPGATLVVDRAIETKSGDIVIARIGEEFCVKKLFIDDEGRVLLLSKNDNYKPIEITEDMDFEVWGKVVGSINRH